MKDNSIGLRRNIGSKEEKSREIEFDILRIMAMVAVIVTHVCGSAIHDLPVNSFSCISLNIIRAAITWDVPLFVMISGRFFLDPTREISVEKIYKKYIMHVFVAFYSWSAVYTIYYMYVGVASGIDLLRNWKEYLYEFVTGPYHMWYLFMLMGLYIATPILRKIVCDKKIMEYYILLFIAFQFIEQYGKKMPFLSEIISTIWDKSYLQLTGYVGYFILGYYLYKYKLPKKMEQLLYGVTIILIVFSCVATTMMSINEGVINEWFSQYRTPNIIIESSGVYVFILNHVRRIHVSDRTKRWITNLGKWSFGIYLSHALIIEFVCGTLNITAAWISPFLAIPVITILVLGLSVLLVWLLSKIPILNRWIL